MNSFVARLALFLAGTCAWAGAQSYTNFVRQVQLPSGVQWDMTVTPTGTQYSMLPVDVGGARFELWSVLSSPLTSYLLDTRYVSAYIPVADVTIRTEDPYAVIPRTRADRPFWVDLTVSGLLSGSTNPPASQSVTFLRYVQSYGVGGTGTGLDRTQATLLSQASVVANGKQTLSYAITSVPSSNPLKVRGEETFSVFSIADTISNVPASQLASKTVQIWPVADASISGIAQGQKLRFNLPQLTFTYNDLYPSSRTYAQVYRGDPALGTNGTVVPGSSLVVNDQVPNSRVLVVNDYGAIFTDNGRWTLEILTTTPFGTDRLAYVSFDISRSIQLNGMVSTME